MDISKRAYSIREFGLRYSIGRTTIYREVAEGRLRILKVARRSLITNEAEEAWLAALAGNDKVSVVPDNSGRGKK